MKNRKHFCSLVALAGVCASLELSGCAQRPPAVQAGVFRVTVETLVAYPSMQVAQINIQKEGSGDLKLDADMGHGGFVVNTHLAPQPGQSVSTAALVLVADAVASPQHGPPTVLHLVGHVSAAEGTCDGSSIWPAHGNPQCAPLLGILKTGAYPTGKAIPLGPVAGKPVFLTVSDDKT